MKIRTTVLCLLSSLWFYACHTPQKYAEDTGPRKIEILFLGHRSDHHPSEQYAPILAAALSRHGIDISYTNDPNDLNAGTLNQYDGLILYANYDEITPSQERALLNFVDGGKGFIPIHCASYCFRNSAEYVELVGAQFLRHDTATFTARIVNDTHPVTKGLEAFKTWDETYVHHEHNPDRTVLMERKEGDTTEPWTWVREQGEGRVFYTAYGHDERTWNHPGFQKLMENGIVWAVGDRVKSQWEQYMAEEPALAYTPKPNIPNYEQRDPAPQFQAPLPPEESKKLIQIPVGFRLELFASEPDIINPIAMDWDERGRLWVIETVDYPNSVRNAAGVGDDRIKICEDTDGDGRADKFTVFAEDLNIPTSLVLANGGVIVSQAPNFLFLKDTNGDDRADVRETIITGWGTFDTHAGPSNLTYGLDNYIWGTVGYSGFEGQIAGQDRKFSQGLYRFAPDASDFEYLTSTSNNTWGLGFTETFDVFASTANNTHSVYLGIPDRYYEGVVGIPTNGSIKIDGHYAMHPITEHVRQVDVFGGFTAASGHRFYTARDFPETYWNTMALVCEPTGHLLHMAMIEKEGAGFTEKDGWNLLASADEWVSPVEAKVGPDGAVWVADWYNFIVQHNPTPNPERGGYQAENGDGNAYINPLRDKEHGRIWRIVYKNAKPYEPMTLSQDDPAGLVAALGNDNMFWRTTAQRLLVERKNLDVLPDLYRLINHKTIDDQGMNPAAVHALWTLHGLGALDSTQAYRVAVGALRHPAAGVRKAAVQVLPRTPWANLAILQASVLHDTDPHTRLAAFLALSEMEPSAKLGKMLYELSMDEEIQSDAWLAKALYNAAVRHQKGFTDAFLAAYPNYETMRAQLAAMPTSESISFNDASWETMALPQTLEEAGRDIDGVVWFRKNITIPEVMTGKAATLHLGAIDESDEAWVNGTRVGATREDDRQNRAYPVAAGVLKAGNNLVAVKIEDRRGRGGFIGAPEQMALRVGNREVSLAGDWKYDIEEVFRGTAIALDDGRDLADLFMDNYWGVSQPSSEVVAASATENASQTITIQTVKNEMKYDLTEFTIEAGKTVELVFENPDFMQHNLLVLQAGTLEKVGAAADALATSPDGAAQGYVPDIPEVLAATPLVDPGETVRLTFTAPEEPGAYPYVCTFPGHWRIMQGTMKVIADSQSI